MIGKRGQRIGANAIIQYLNNEWRKGTSSDPAAFKRVGDNHMANFNRIAPLPFVDYRNIDFENDVAIARTEEPIDRFREGNMGLMSRTRSRATNLGILRQDMAIKAMAPEIEGMGAMQLTSGIRSSAPEIGIMQATSGLRASAPDIGQSYDIGLGQTAAELELFRRDLHKLTKRVRNFNPLPLFGTSAAEEKSVYQALKGLMQRGRTILTGVYSQIPPIVDSELARWFYSRQYALTGKGENTKGIAKVRERELANLNRARIIIGLAPVALSPIVIGKSVAAELEEQKKKVAIEKPAAQTSPDVPVEIRPPGLSKGAMIGIGVAIAAVAAFVYFKKR